MPMAGCHKSRGKYIVTGDEEVTQRTVALCVEATKLSAGMLQQAMKKVLDEMQKAVTGHKTKLHHGKQTLR